MSFAAGAFGAGLFLATPSFALAFVFALSFVLTFAGGRLVLVAGLALEAFVLTFLAAGLCAASFF